MRKALSCLLCLIIASPALAGCPSGYYTVEKRPDTQYRVQCDAGYSDGGLISTCDADSFDSCYAELTCNATRKTIKASNGTSVSLYGQPGDGLAIGFKFDDGQSCYAPLGNGAQSGAINISTGTAEYHTGALHECLKTGTAATCHQVVPAEYSIDYTINCSGDNLLGIALCSNKGGTALTTTAEEVSTSNTATDNLYCWCAVISPAVSYYALYGTLSTATGCSKSCAIQCAKEIADNSSFRTVIFSTFSN